LSFNRSAALAISFRGLGYKTWTTVACGGGLFADVGSETAQATTAAAFVISFREWSKLKTTFLPPSSTTGAASVISFHGLGYNT
jgi:hypothetical protein